MRLISVKVCPNAKKNKIVEGAEGLKVWLTAPALEGKANKALIAELAAHFKVKKNAIKIIKGEKSHEKLISVGE